VKPISVKCVDPGSEPLAQSASLLIFCWHRRRTLVPEICRGFRRDVGSANNWIISCYRCLLFSILNAALEFTIAMSCNLVPPLFASRYYCSFVFFGQMGRVASIAIIIRNSFAVAGFPCSR
jgi:hypothetical protein